MHVHLHQLSDESACKRWPLKAALSCAGLDSADLISQLRASHAHDARSRLGVDVLTGGAGDMDKLGIFESFKVRADCSSSCWGFVWQKSFDNTLISCPGNRQECRMIMWHSSLVESETIHCPRR